MASTAAKEEYSSLSTSCSSPPESVSSVRDTPRARAFELLRRIQRVGPTSSERFEGVSHSSPELDTAAPSTRSQVASFTALQEWDGYVVSKGHHSFIGRLTDLTSKGAADAEEVEIPYEELSDTTGQDLEPGALFRWSIGYERAVGGQKTRVSRIVVRRLPRWRSSKISEAHSTAVRMQNSIDWR